MWENNKEIRYLYSSHGPQAAWAVFDGLTGWKRVRAGSGDGVNNVAQVLATAKAHGRKVNVYLNGGQIERALLR